MVQKYADNRPNGFFSSLLYQQVAAAVKKEFQIFTGDTANFSC